MCIRDRYRNNRGTFTNIGPAVGLPVSGAEMRGLSWGDYDGCLLYTSDAADERSSVDLGGRRIIKKKKTYK